MQLAEQTGIAALRTFLLESARQYLRAADDIRTAGKLDANEFASRRRIARCAPADDAEVTDVAASWERAECEALTYFRDAYDGLLPDEVAETVKRHFEAGVARLERLRKLQLRLA